MAPTSKRRSSEKPQAPTTTTARRIMTRSIYKQSLVNTNKSPMKFVETKQRFLQQQQNNNYNQNQKSVSNDSSSTTTTKDVCSTPKSEKYKIPEIMTCPPAPKKPKNSKCLFHKRRPISFFAHPDIDKFFVFAMTDNTNTPPTSTPTPTIKCE